jgi:hypothetical protein
MSKWRIPLIVLFVILVIGGLLVKRCCDSPHGRLRPPIYGPDHQWSTDTSALLYSTGVAFADLNGDGRKDLVFSAGNDLANQPVTVHFHSAGSGSGDLPFPKKPDWVSSAKRRHGKLTTGDLNGDGCIDVVVAVMMVIGSDDAPLSPLAEADGFSVAGKVEIYWNAPAAAENAPCKGLQEPPTLLETGEFPAGVEVGDFDGDADLDIAVAAMFGATPWHSSRVKIFVNQAGSFTSESVWLGNPVTIARAGDAHFADRDGDGFLDLLFSGIELTVLPGIANGSGATLSPTTAWKSGPFSSGWFTHAGWSVDVSHAEDGTCERIGVAPGCWVWGSCDQKYRVFSGPNPAATLASQGHNFDLALRNLDGDEHPDLIVNRWPPTSGSSKASLIVKRGGAGCELGDEEYQPIESTFDGVPEQMDFADVEADATIAANDIKLKPARDGAHVVSLPHGPTERITSVRKNGIVLSAMKSSDANPDYVMGHRGEWISFREMLRATDEILVSYSYTRCADVVIANFKRESADKLYFNQSTNCMMGE